MSRSRWIPPTVPEPPRYVTGYASAEWHAVATELHRLGLLTKIDVSMLAAYCMAYARWRTAEEALARMADRDEHRRAAGQDHGRHCDAESADQDRCRCRCRHAGLCEAICHDAKRRIRLASGDYGPSPPSKFGDPLK
jgi:phage terminase small subunit